MEKLLSFRCLPLTAIEKDEFKRLIHVRRAQVVDRSLEALTSSRVRARLGGYQDTVVSFLKELGTLARCRPRHFESLVQHWSVAFLLSRLLFDQDLDDNPQQFSQLASNLSSIMIFERLLHEAPLPAAQYKVSTDGAGMLHSLAHGRSLEILGGAANQFTEWSFSNGSVTVSAGSGASFCLPVPIAESPFVATVELSKLVSRDFPVLEENVLLGRNISHGGNSKNPASVNWLPMAMVETLDGAQKILDLALPGTLDWASVFIPAFVDTGPTESYETRISGSYEPGTPVFLCQVREPVCHAEDIVHELQHHRLLLLANSTHFKFWNSTKLSYISPYRPDPRPLRGLYLGVHALLAVNEMKRRFIQQGEGSERLVAELAYTHYQNLFALRTILEHEEFSAYGEHLTSQMATVVVEHHEFVRSMNRPDVQSLAREKLAAHVDRVQRQSQELLNGSLPYQAWEESIKLAESYSRRAPSLPS